MEDLEVDKLLNFFATGAIPAGVSTAGNWRRYAGKFKSKQVNGNPLLFRILKDKANEEEKVEKLVLRKSELDRVWDEMHNQFHAGRTKT